MKVKSEDLEPRYAQNDKSIRPIFLCNKALVMEIIKKLLWLVRFINTLTESQLQDFPLENKPFHYRGKKQMPVQWRHLEKVV